MVDLPKPRNVVSISAGDNNKSLRDVLSSIVKSSKVINVESINAPLHNTKTTILVKTDVKNVAGDFITEQRHVLYTRLDISRFITAPVIVDDLTDLTKILNKLNSTYRCDFTTDDLEIVNNKLKAKPMSLGYIGSVDIFESTSGGEETGGIPFPAEPMVMYPGYSSFYFASTTELEITWSDYIEVTRAEETDIRPGVKLYHYEGKVSVFEAPYARIELRPKKPNEKIRGFASYAIDRIEQWCTSGYELFADAHDAAGVAQMIKGIGSLITKVPATAPPNTTDFDYMFYEAGGNYPRPDISRWDMSKAESMNYMLTNSGIDADLSHWCMTNFLTMPEGFMLGAVLGNLPDKQPVWGTCPAPLPPVDTDGELVDVDYMYLKGDPTAPSFVFTSLTELELICAEPGNISPMVDDRGDEPRYMYGVYYNTPPADGVWFKIAPKSHSGQIKELCAYGCSEIVRWWKGGYDGFSRGGSYQGLGSSITVVPDHAPPNTTDLSYMFYYNTKINAPVMKGWVVRDVVNMDYFLHFASAFQQSLAGWCVPNIPTKPVEFCYEPTLPASKQPVWGTCPIPGAEPATPGGGEIFANFTIGANADLTALIALAIDTSGAANGLGVSVFIDGVEDAKASYDIALMSQDPKFAFSTTVPEITPEEIASLGLADVSQWSILKILYTNTTATAANVKFVALSPGICKFKVL